MPSVSSSRPICEAHSSETASAAAASPLPASPAPISASTSAPSLRPNLDQEAVLPLEQLGEREVVAGLCSRAGLHRDAEAGVARLRAVDRDDEGVASPGLVVGIGVRVPDEDFVLNRDRGQVAGAHADEGVARPLLLLLLVGDRAVLRALRLPEGQVGREEVMLPGVRAVVEAEERFVIALVEPVGAALLLVSEPLGQVGKEEISS